MTDGICFQVKQNSGMSHPLGSDGRGGGDKNGLQILRISFVTIVVSE